MSGSTTKLNLYKPGGGSTGLILPDEIVDIDKINSNMDKIDAAMGAVICTSVTRPATPYDGQLIYETDTGQLMAYRASTTTWVSASSAARGTRTVYYAATPAALHAVANDVFGDLAYIETAAGIFGSWWGYDGGSGKWSPLVPINAVTKAQMDTFIASMAALGTLAFAPGGLWVNQATKITYEFTTAAGAYRTRAGRTPIIPTSVAGSGVSVGAGGVVALAGATTASLNGIFSADFDNYEIEIDIPIHGAPGGILNFKLRAGGVDDSTGSGYRSQVTQQFNASNISALGTATSGALTAAVGDEDDTVVELFGPFIAQATRWYSRFTQVAAGILVSGTVGGRHNPATAFDGITIIPSAGNMFGSIRVFGINKN